MTNNPATPALDLAAIDALANAATVGPWSADIVEPHDMVVWGVPRFEGDDSPPLIMNIGEPIARVGDVCGSAADAHFIAAARTLVPALVARVRELESERADIISMRNIMLGFGMMRDDESVQQSMGGANQNYGYEKGRADRAEARVRELESALTVDDAMADRFRHAYTLADDGEHATHNDCVKAGLRAALERAE